MLSFLLSRRVSQQLWGGPTRWAVRGADGGAERDLRRWIRARARLGHIKACFIDTAGDSGPLFDFIELMFIYKRNSSHFSRINKAELSNTLERASLRLPVIKNEEHWLLLGNEKRPASRPRGSAALYPHLLIHLTSPLATSSPPENVAYHPK